MFAYNSTVRGHGADWGKRENCKHKGLYLQSGQSLTSLYAPRPVQRK